MTKPAYLSAKEAAAELGISLPTLYSYVSRGLVRSEVGGGGPRQRRYLREDVERLKERQEGRRDPGHSARQALHWGEPVLESSLTLIDNGRLYYRGQDAAELADHSQFEQVAALLWRASREGNEPAFSSKPLKPTRPAGSEPPKQKQAQPQLSTLEAFQSALITAEAQDPAAYNLRADAVAVAGARILGLMTSVASGNASAHGTIAERLQASWAPNRPEVTRLIDAALILCADHELNVSSFTVRCVASAGSTPYAAVIAGLAALQGGRHGGMVERVQSLFQEIDYSGQPPNVLANRLRRNEAIPGFGHRLYPQGDPRARKLFELLRQARPASPELAQVEAILSAAQEMIGEHPTIDLALAAFSRVLPLPPASAITLFAIGRTAGWIAHAIEQYQSGQLIRPRAHYTGPVP